MCTIIAQVIPILLHMDPDSLLNCGRSHQPPPQKKRRRGGFPYSVNAGLLTVSTDWCATGRCGTT